MNTNRLQVFKNGHALVSKSYTLPDAGQVDGSFSLGEPPQDACHGTVWLTSQDSTKVLGMRVEKTTTTTGTMTCPTTSALLKANKGVKVSLQVSCPQGTECVEGEVVDVSISEQNSSGLVILRTNTTEEHPTLTSIPIADVRQVSGTGGDFKWKQPVQTEKKEVILDYEGKGDATFTHLRKGFCWAPSYHWQLLDDTTASLLSNATIMNESEEGGFFDQLQCVVGAPNMKFGGVRDPLLISAPIDQFLREYQLSADTTGRHPHHHHHHQHQFGFPPQMQQPMQMQQQQQPMQMQQQMPMQPSQPFRPGGDNDGSNKQGAGSADDVHFLEFENVKLEPKSRVALPIFNTTEKYSNVFRASSKELAHNIDPHGRNNTSLEVWRALRVANHTEKPWTTAPVMISKDGCFIAQGIVPYTPVGTEALVNVTKALNIRCKYDVKQEMKANHTETVMGERCSVKLQHTTITVNNGKPLDIDMVIDFSTTGQLTKSSLPPKRNEEIHNSFGYNEMNRQRELQYQFNVPAGGSLQIDFTCKLVFPIH